MGSFILVDMLSRAAGGEDRDAAGENLKDPEKRTLGDAMKQRGDR